MLMFKYAKMTQISMPWPQQYLNKLFINSQAMHYLVRPSDTVFGIYTVLSRNRNTMYIKYATEIFYCLA